jgi:hypothetical protein
VYSPDTLETLEALDGPYDPSVLMTHQSMTMVSPGDFGFMIGNGATVAPLQQS